MVKSKYNEHAGVATDYSSDENRIPEYHHFAFTPAHLLMSTELMQHVDDDHCKREEVEAWVNGDFNRRDYFMVTSSTHRSKLSSTAKVYYCWYGDDKEPAVDIAAIEICLNRGPEDRSVLEMTSMTWEFSELGVHPGVLSVNEKQLDELLDNRVKLFVSKSFLPAEMIQYHSIGRKNPKKFICFKLDEQPKQSEKDLPKGCSGTMVYVKKRGKERHPYHRIGMYAGYLCNGIYWAVNLSENIRRLEQIYPRLKGNLFSPEWAAKESPLINEFKTVIGTAEDLESDHPTQATSVQEPAKPFQATDH